MATDDFLLDQLERDQQQQTQRRRDLRSRKRQLYVLVVLSLGLLTLVGAPSLASHSSIGRSLLVQTLAGYELDATVASIRIGWVTPLRIQGLKIQGRQGSQFLIDQLEADVTVIDLLRSGANDLGEVSVRGVDVQCAVDQGRCNLEDDFRLLLAPSDEPSSMAASVKLQDVSVAATDVVTGMSWKVNQSSAEATVSAAKIEASFAGVLTEPGGSGGSIQGAVLYSPELIERGSSNGEPARLWRLQISCESLPLSVAALVRRRFDELTKSLPRTIHGDATGGVVVQSLGDGTIELVLDDLRVRNLTAADDGSRVWSNGLASIRGSLVLRGERVIGHQLQAATDFASATIDGAFSRTFSFVGANDNPLRWLDAIDGTATAEVDLAALDRSLPGLLPLRNDAIILSGKVRGTVDSSPNGATRRSRLFIETEPLRARAGSQAVVIDPIKLSAVVSNLGGQLRAEQFEWNSAFGGAVGHGDLRSGVADFEFDFGRLTAMLRPVLQIGETSLAGSASGSVRWDAAADSVWRLSGSADANNLLIAFPSGQSLRRASLRGTVDAVGRWGDGALQELSSANLSIVGSGLDVRAELVQPVQQPHENVPLPIKLTGTGRLESLTETIGPWLPRELVDLSGGFQVTAMTQLATTATQLTSASIELTEPSMQYLGHRLSQSKVQIQFDGSYSLPDHRLEARDLTVSGNAFSSRVSGKMNATDVDLDIQWRALLDRLHGSVRRPLAADTNTPIRPVGYRADGTSTSATTEEDQWTFQGDCQGSVVLKSNQRSWDITVEANANNLAILQPWTASAQYRLVGPVPSATVAGQTTSTNASVPAGQVVWSEPNLKVNGSFRYDPATLDLSSDSIQVASDWFATTLKGRLANGPNGQELVVEGPARLKMDEVATRLTSLFEIPISAEGVHETPLQIRASQSRNGQSLSGSMQLAVQASVGWEAAEVAGVPLGRATVPVRMTETTVEISPSRIPVGQGFVNLAGQVHHRPGPIWVQLDRGVVAESVRLTPEMTSRWLKYLAPIAAEATQLDGILGAELDEAVIVFDRPEQSRVVGRLNIGSVQLNAGPLADQVLNGIKQLKTLSGGLNTPVDNNTGTTLIRMPAQTVDFAVHQGVVSHDRLFFEIDRAQVVTSGRVAFDGRLNMIAMVPLDARWLGSDLKGLAGQTVTLPIDGTLSRPSLDSSGVAQLVTQLGTQAVQSTAENYLQQQLNRGMERLFGR